MSGTFERLSYDDQAYQTYLKQSTAPLKYRLDPLSSNQCNPTRPPDVGYIGKVGVSLTHQRPLIDVESDLKLLNYPKSKDPSQMYQPYCPQCNKCKSGYPCGDGTTKGCCNCQERLHHFPINEHHTEHSRLTNPICTARGVGINRFQPLCLNPQDENRWLHPSEVGINYRLVVKDNHVPCIPKLVDPTPLLPKGGKLPCHKVKNICGNYIKPLHNDYKTLNRNWNGLKYY